MADQRIESISRADLEARLREAVLARREGDPFDDLELEHLIRVVSRCSVLLGDIYTPDRVRTILERDARRVAGLCDAPLLLTGEKGSPVDRFRWLPDQVRVVADKCLFDLGVSGLERIHGVLLTDLGPQAYGMASDLLDLLAEDPHLREHFLDNRLGRTLPIEEEVVFLRRCADKFPVYADLLRRIACLEDEPTATPRNLLALVPSAPAALEPIPPAPAEEPPPSDDLSRSLLVRDRVSGRDQLLSLWERTLLFGTLNAAELRQALRWRVVDQDAAVDALCDEFALYAAGTNEAGRPASYFLVGPTGVGKNLLVETLVSLLGTLWDLEVPLLTLEGPNFTYPSDINELRGAARGFIRSDEQGLLSEFEERSAQSPLCVILVDEVEKAHPQLRKFFLSIMDRGTITDAHGRTLRFGNALLFFTSNIGYRPGVSNSRPIGFGDDEAASEAYQSDLTRELKRSLSPEFINRLRVLRFRHLGRGSIEKIFDLEFEKIASRFRELHEIEFVATPAAKEALIGRGYSREYGARHLAGVLHDLCNVAVSKMVRADDRNRSRDAGDALAYLREIRGGERAYDAEEVQARVRRAARAHLLYTRIVVDAQGDRILYRPEGG